MEDKGKFLVILRAFKAGSINIDFTVEHILKVQEASSRFNFTNFMRGVYLGALIAFIVINYI